MYEGMYEETLPVLLKDLKSEIYLCNWIGVLPMKIGIISPAAPSLVVFGVNLSAIIVTLTVGSLSRMHTAVESPMIPAPTTATDAMSQMFEEGTGHETK